MTGPRAALTAVIKNCAGSTVIQVCFSSCTVVKFALVFRMSIESIWLSITESWSWCMSCGRGGCGGFNGGLTGFGGGGWRQWGQFYKYSILH